MNAANSRRLLQHIRRLAADPQRTPSDGDLLRRYLEAGDPSAFADLVRRHGTMVFAVCQSVLRQRDDAEDAFQAVFLILSQKAGSIRQQEGLSGWLQRVAYRVALKARANKVRRQKREAKATAPGSTASTCDDLSWGEVRAILHEEIAALPESLRAPLVLCYLEGLTQEEAARHLGWTAATVKGRLQRGREKLRRPLERRGVGLAAALGAALTGQTLAATAARTSGPLTMETATTTAVALARGFARPILSMKLAMLSAVLLSIGVVAGGVALRSPQQLGEGTPAAADDKPAEKRLPPRAAVDAHGDSLPDGAVARLGTVRFNHGDGLSHLFFSPDGKTIFSEGGSSLRVWDAATGKERGHRASTPQSFDNQLVLMPDGKRMISLRQESSGVTDVVRVWDLTQMKEIRKLSLPVRRGDLSVYRSNALSPDGKFGAINLPTEMRIFDLTVGRELYKLGKGGKDIRAVIFAASDRLVTADAKQIIDVWDVQTGKSIRRFDCGAPAGFLAASPDGHRLAVLEHHDRRAFQHFPDKDTVHIWDLTAGVKKLTLPARPKHWFRTASFFADGKRLLTSSIVPQGTQLTVWDAATGERLHEMMSEAHSSPPIVAVSTDGSRLAVGENMGKFDLWDLKRCRNLSGAVGCRTWAATVLFSPTAHRVHTVGYHSFSTWDDTSGRCLDSIDLQKTSDWATPRRSFSPDGRYALSFAGKGKEFQAVIWNVAARRRLHTLSFPSNSDYVYLDSAFSPDSSLLATCHPDKEAVVRIWDVRSGKEVRSFKASKTGRPGQLSFSADGKTLLVAGTHIVGFDPVGGKELFSWYMKPLPDNSGMGMFVDGKPVDPNSRRAWRGLAVSPDGTRLACTLDGGFGSQRPKDRIALFDARSGKLLRRWSDSGKPSPSVVIQGYEEMVFSPDGQRLGSSDGFAIHLWEVATGKEIRTFHGHRGEINSLAFSGDGRRLASTSWDSTVLIWDLTGRSADERPTREAIEKYWTALLGDDAGRVDRAVWALARAPELSLSMFERRLHPVQAVHREQIDRWIKDLDGDQFEIREKATVELEKLGELAEPALRRILKNKPTLEQRRRIEPMLAKLEMALPSGESLRSLRAVRVLEHAATAETEQLLRELARGAEGASLTRAAQVALARLSRRSP